MENIQSKYCRIFTKDDKIHWLCFFGNKFISWDVKLNKSKILHWDNKWCKSIEYYYDFQGVQEYLFGYIF